MIFGRPILQADRVAGNQNWRIMLFYTPDIDDGSDFSVKKIGGLQNLQMV